MCIKTQRGWPPCVWGTSNLPCLGVGDRGGTGRRGGQLCGSQIAHDGFGDTGCHVPLVTDSSLSHICLPMLCSRPSLGRLAPPSSRLLISLPPWNSLCLQPSLDQVVGIQLRLLFLPFHALPVCLTSVPDPVLTSRQYYSSQRHAEFLEAPNYVWHHPLPFSGCPELYMRYVLEDVQ